jgi:diacylglycerol kinase (ATP)
VLHDPQRVQQGTAKGGCATQALPSAALFHPAVDHRHLAPFKALARAITAVVRLDKEARFGAALIFGGDGTIHRHLRSLIEHKIPLLPVPVGSGNDFANALGIKSVGDALAAWQRFCSDEGNVREIDAAVIRATQALDRAPLETANPKLATYFCNVAGIGLDSEANRLANAMPRWLRSNGGYILSALKAILTFPSTLVTISTESGPAPRISEQAMLVAVANTPAYGNGMRIAPLAQLTDGMLDVCFVRRTGRWRLLRNFPRVFRGEHLQLPEVKYFQTPRLLIESERPLELHADGEPICRTPFEIEVAPRALRVIVPAV